MAAADDSSVVVVGSGIIGACCAFFLARDGARVTLIDPNPAGGRHAASFGNGGFISPASIVPMSVPGLWRRVPAYLMDRNGPLTIRLRHLPALLPWLFRFMWAGATTARVQRTARILNSLLCDAPARHKALAEMCACPELVRHDGLLYAFENYDQFREEAFAWRLRRDNGMRWKELQADELRRFEPALSDAYGFAALVEAGAHCVDPAAYVAAIAMAAERLGASRLQARVQGFVRDGGRLLGVRTNQNVVRCGAVVIAAGMASKAFAGAAGDFVPLEAERGYHIEIERPGIRLQVPVMPGDGKMANTMMRHGLRASGQVELASADAEPDWRRARILLRHLQRTYPQLERDMAEDRLHFWQGNRPSTADGLPVIGRSRRQPEVLYGFGHGHTGFSAGPVTGKLITDIVQNRRTDIDITPFSPDRFHRLL